MQEAVSGILVARSREVDGLSRMVTLSLGLHAVMLTAIVFMPKGWLTSETESQHRPMMISLGGTASQSDTGGMTSIASRPVQEAAPDAKHEVTPPAVKTPEMIAPTPEAKPKPATKPIEKPVDKSSTRKPAVGPQVRSGAARAETGGAEVPFGGLAQGGPGTGVRIEGDFCCPEYIETMKRYIHGNWNQQQGAAGRVEVKFTIRRDGMLTGVVVETTSGNPLLDLESRRAVLATQKIPPLPDQFTRPNLTIYLTFEYKR